MKDMSVSFSHVGPLAQALASHYGGVAQCNQGKAGEAAAWNVSVDGERLVVLTNLGAFDVWLFVGEMGAMSRDVWMLSDAVAFIDSTRAEIITSAQELACGLAAHYGRAAVRGSRDNNVWKIEGATSDALPLAVVSFDIDPAGLFLFSGGRGMVQPIGWSLVDAIAFIDRIQNAGGVAGVMSRDGVIFRYSVEVVVTVCGGETTFTPNGAELIGLENDKTGEDITGEDYDLIVGTYGPIADARLAKEIGGLS